MTMTPIEEAVRQAVRGLPGMLCEAEVLRAIATAKRVLSERVPHRPVRISYDTGYNQCRRDLGLED